MWTLRSSVHNTRRHSKGLLLANNTQVVRGFSGTVTHAQGRKRKRTLRPDRQADLVKQFKRWQAENNALSHGGADAQLMPTPHDPADLLLDIRRQNKMLVTQESMKDYLPPELVSGASGLANRKRFRRFTAFSIPDMVRLLREVEVNPPTRKNPLPEVKRYLGDVEGLDVEAGEDLIDGEDDNDEEVGEEEAEDRDEAGDDSVGHHYTKTPAELEEQDEAERKGDSIPTEHPWDYDEETAAIQTKRAEWAFIQAQRAYIKRRKEKQLPLSVLQTRIDALEDFPEEFPETDYQDETRAPFKWETIVYDEELDEATQVAVQQFRASTLASAKDHARSVAQLDLDQLDVDQLDSTTLASTIDLMQTATTSLTNRLLIQTPGAPPPEVADPVVNKALKDYYRVYATRAGLGYEDTYFDRQQFKAEMHERREALSELLPHIQEVYAAGNEVEALEKLTEVFEAVSRPDDAFRAARLTNPEDPYLSYFEAGSNPIGLAAVTQGYEMPFTQVPHLMVAGELDWAKQYELMLREEDGEDVRTTDETGGPTFSRNPNANSQWDLYAPLFAPGGLLDTDPFAEEYLSGKVPRQSKRRYFLRRYTKEIEARVLDATQAARRREGLLDADEVERMDLLASIKERIAQAVAHKEGGRLEEARGVLSTVIEDLPEAFGGMSQIPDDLFRQVNDLRTAVDPRFARLAQEQVESTNSMRAAHWDSFMHQLRPATDPTLPPGYRIPALIDSESHALKAHNATYDAKAAALAAEEQNLSPQEFQTKQAQLRTDRLRDHARLLIQGYQSRQALETEARDHVLIAHQRELASDTAHYESASFKDGAIRVEKEEEEEAEEEAEEETTAATAPREPRALEGGFKPDLQLAPITTVPAAAVQHPPPLRAGGDEQSEAQAEDDVAEEDQAPLSAPPSAIDGSDMRLTRHSGSSRNLNRFRGSPWDFLVVSEAELMHRRLGAEAALTLVNEREVDEAVLASVSNGEDLPHELDHEEEEEEEEELMEEEEDDATEDADAEVEVEAEEKDTEEAQVRAEVLAAEAARSHITAPNATERARLSRVTRKSNTELQFLAAQLSELRTERLALRQEELERLLAPGGLGRGPTTFEQLEALSRFDDVDEQLRERRGMPDLEEAEDEDEDEDGDDGEADLGVYYVPPQNLDPASAAESEARELQDRMAVMKYHERALGIDAESVLLDADEEGDDEFEQDNPHLFPQAGRNSKTKALGAGARARARAGAGAGAATKQSEAAAEPEQDQADDAEAAKAAEEAEDPDEEELEDRDETPDDKSRMRAAQRGERGGRGGRGRGGRRGGGSMSALAREKEEAELELEANNAVLARVDPRDEPAYQDGFLRVKELQEQARTLRESQTNDPELQYTMIKEHHATFIPAGPDGKPDPEFIDPQLEEELADGLDWIGERLAVDRVTEDDALAEFDTDTLERGEALAYAAARAREHALVDAREGEGAGEAIDLALDEQDELDEAQEAMEVLDEKRSLAMLRQTIRRRIQAQSAGTQAQAADAHAEGEEKDGDAEPEQAELTEFEARAVLLRQQLKRDARRSAALTDAARGAERAAKEAELEELGTQLQQQQAALKDALEREEAKEELIQEGATPEEAEARLVEMAAMDDDPEEAQSEEALAEEHEDEDEEHEDEDEQHEDEQHEDEDEEHEDEEHEDEDEEHEDEEREDEEREDEDEENEKEQEQEQGALEKQHAQEQELQLRRQTEEEAAEAVDVGVDDVDKDVDKDVAKDVDEDEDEDEDEDVLDVEAVEDEDEDGAEEGREDREGAYNRDGRGKRDAYSRRGDKADDKDSDRDREDPDNEGGLGEDNDLELMSERKSEFHWRNEGGTEQEDAYFYPSNAPKKLDSMESMLDQMGILYQHRDYGFVGADQDTAAAFDSAYSHTDLADDNMRQKVDPNWLDGPRKPVIRKPQMEVEGEMVATMYELHGKDPSKYNPRALARLSGYEVDKVVALLRMCDREERMRQAGWVEEFGGFLDEHMWNMAMDNLMRYHALYSHAELGAIIDKLGTQKDDLFNTLDAHISPSPMWSLPEGTGAHAWRNLDRYTHLGNWEPFMNPELSSLSGYVPYTPIDDAYDWEKVMGIEEKRKRTFETREETLERADAERYKRDGALMAPIPAQSGPQILSKSRQPKQRWGVQLTEVGDLSNASAQIAIRDRRGVLRGPNADEFWFTRYRERRPQQAFYYRRYREHPAQYPQQYPSPSDTPKALPVPQE